MAQNSKILPFSDKIKSESTIDNSDQIPPDDTTEVISSEELSKLIGNFLSNRDKGSLTKEGLSMADQQNDQYIDQRFKNVDEKIDHKMEVVSLKIDAITESINSNTEWMKKMVDSNSRELTEFKNDGKTTRSTIKTTAIVSVISIVIGLSTLLYMLAQMQGTWMQSYLDIFVNALLK